MYEGIEYRGFGQEIVEELKASYAAVPVWNGLTDAFHPTQMLADMLTIREHLGRLSGCPAGISGRCPVQYGQFLYGGLCQAGMHLRPAHPWLIFRTVHW